MFETGKEREKEFEITFIRKADIDPLVTKRNLGYGINGKFENIKITSDLSGGGLPDDVREALKGAVIETWFTQEELIEICGEKLATLIPLKTRLAFISAVEMSLKNIGKIKEAEALRGMFSNSSDLVAFPEGSFEIV